MGNFSSSSVTERPRPIPAPSGTDESSDGHLLGLFIQHKDESAFAELVHRHGQMVLGVCRRVLDNRHDAEDCFQAAFLVLVRKAATIQPREMVGNWLYGVAYRTALEAKKMAARRRNRERRKFDMARPDADHDRWQDLQPVLDQELSRLPSKYRGVLVACDLEGRTRKEVAQALGLPEGTVASRLARARALLAKRLTRRNLSMSATALAALLAEKAAASGVPAALVASTTEAAALLAAGKPIAGLVSGNVAALIQGVVRSMLIAKLKIASAILVALALLGLGVGMMIPPVSAGRKTEPEGAVVKLKKAKPRQVNDCIVENIDLQNMSIQAVKTDPDNGGSVVLDFQVDATTAILVDGAEAKLTDLKIGVYMNVQFERSADGKTRAVRIEAAGKAFAGVVEALNHDTVTIQFSKKPDQQTYDLDRNAWVHVDGKKAKLSDLKAKMLVALRMSAGKPTVVGISAAGPKVSGIVKSVEQGSLSLGAAIIPVAPDAVVMIDGKQSALADLRVGMAVTLQMAAESERNCIVGILCAKP